MNEGDVRAITMKQPFAWAASTGRKKFENQSWTTKFRGPLLIHAGVKADMEGRQWMLEERKIKVPLSLPSGVFVGVCELVDVVTASKDPFFCGPHGSVLKNARALPGPIAATGKLGLWIPSMKDIRAVIRQLKQARDDCGASFRSVR